MTSTGYRPQDVPRLIARQRDFLNSPAGEQVLRMQVVKAEKTDPGRQRKLLRTEASPAGHPSRLANHDGCEDCLVDMEARMIVLPFMVAEAYFITGEMMRLADVAADMAANLALRVDRDDPPSASGVLVFDEQLHVRGMRPAVACTWSLIRAAITGPHGLEGPAGSEVIIHLRMLQESSIDDRQLFPLLPGVGIDIIVGCDAELDDDAGGGIAHLIRWVTSVWQFMAMPRPAQVTVYPTNAHDRKTAARLGVRPEVRVIDVRPREKAQVSAEVAAAEAEKAGREYHHRWLVRMHWRKQWHPKTGVHKPKLIYPYLKGPEGAPLLTPRPTVKVLDS
jgi:hypothetical protein